MAWFSGADDFGANVVRLLLVEDSELLRAALARMLSDRPGISVVADLPCTGPVAEQAAAHGAHVAVVGVDSAGCPCLPALADLRDRSPECRIVALTMPDTPEVFVRLVAVPVHAIVDKYASVDRLLTAVQVVVNGGTLIPGEIVELASRASRNPFTAREREVLELAARGATVTEIARGLRLTNGTVRNYLSSVMSKTSARTRIEAIRVARDHGWLDGDDPG